MKSTFGLTWSIVENANDIKFYNVTCESINNKSNLFGKIGHINDALDVYQKKTSCYK